MVLKKHLLRQKALLFSWHFPFNLGHLENNQFLSNPLIYSYSIGTKVVIFKLSNRSGKLANFSNLFKNYIMFSYTVYYMSICRSLPPWAFVCLSVLLSVVDNRVLSNKSAKGYRRTFPLLSRTVNKNLTTTVHTVYHSIQFT